MIAHKVMMCSNDAQPVEVWAVGAYPGPDPTQFRPFCLYKPVGKPWQLQSIGAEFSFTRAVRFDCGCRNPDDTPGVIWAGCWAPAPVCWAAYSADYGVSWNLIPLTDAVSEGAQSQRRVLGIASPSPGHVAVAADDDVGSDPARVAYGDSGALQLSTAVPPVAGGIPGTKGMVRTRSPDMLFAPARSSPIGVDVLAISGANGDDSITLWVSIDGGATWGGQAAGPACGGGAGDGARPGGTFACNRDVALFLAGPSFGSGGVASNFNATSDFSSFTSLKSVIPASNLDGAAVGGIAIAGKKRYRALINGIVYRTNDAGVTWTAVGSLPNGRKLRFLGDRLWAVKDREIWHSGTGATWRADTLPSLPDGAVIADIFGPQYRKAA